MKLSTENIKVNTAEEAQLAIQIIRKRIKLREQDLELRWQQMPKESFKSVTGLVVPAFINLKITDRSWNIVKDVARIVSPFSKNKSKFVLDIVKQIGILGVLKTAMGVFEKQ